MKELSPRIVLSGLAVAFLIVGLALASAEPQSGGNNSEAASFAKAMTDLTRYTWPKGNVIWYLELTPQQIKGDIITYRKSVTHCKASITASEDWVRQSPSDQRAFVRALLDTLHKAPAISSGELDYYPNSSGEVVVKVGNRVVARGTYTKTRTQISLQPGTSRKK